MLKEEKYLDLKMFIDEESKKEENNERRYYRHNISIEYLQKKNVPVEYLYAKDSTSFDRDLDNLLNIMDLVSDLRLLSALKNLNQSDFKVVELRYVKGLSVGEIAIKLQIEKETAKKKNQRVLKKLRSFIEKNS